MSKMLTTHDLQQALKNITYRDGWKMRVYEGVFEGAHLEIIALLEDSVELGKTTEFKVYSAIPPMLTIEQFHLFLSWRLRRIEIHESMEWLKLNGKAIYDPHRFEADQDRL